MYRILIIENDAELREEIAFILNYEGYNVIEAINGDEGIKLAKEIKPNLILCDVLMSGTNGFDVLKEIKKKVHYTSLTFVFISALAESEMIKKSIKMGADNYLVKPFTRQELLDMVKIYSRISAVS